VIAIWIWIWILSYFFICLTIILEYYLVGFVGGVIVMDGVRWFGWEIVIVSGGWFIGGEM
jgi:hypothetical protein